MKKVLLGILAIMMLVIAGCGDASVSVVIPIEPLISGPTITLYSGYTQNPATEVVSGSVVFFAPDSDIDTIDIVVFNSSGSVVSNTRTVLNLPGVIRERIFFSINYRDYPTDTFTFSIILTDFNGNRSNEIVDTFVP